MVNVGQWANRNLVHRGPKIVLAIILFLIALRLALPYALKYYINDVLKDDITGYTGHINDLDLSLYRGAYQMQGLVLKKIEDKVPVPFIDGHEIEFSIAWRPLLRGHVVGKILLDRFKINFVKGPTAETTQAGVEGKGWQKVVDDLFPLDIEELRITGSEVHYNDFSRKPPIDLYLKKVEVTATNLTNADEDDEKLVSGYQYSSTIQKKGLLKSEGRFSLLSQPMAFDMNLAATEVDLTEFSDVFKFYADFDVAKGRFDLFTEAASTDGKIKGYAKPMITGMDTLKERDKKDDGATGTDVIVSIANLLIRRYSKDQIATKVPFEGRLDDPKIGTWAAVKGLFRHAFGDEIPAKIDNEIDINDAKRVQVGKKDKGKDEDKRKKKGNAPGRNSDVPSGKDMRNLK